MSVVTAGDGQANERVCGSVSVSLPTSDQSSAAPQMWRRRRARHGAVTGGRRCDRPTLPISCDCHPAGNAAGAGLRLAHEHGARHVRSEAGGHLVTQRRRTKRARATSNVPIVIELELPSRSDEYSVASLNVFSHPHPQVVELTQSKRSEACSCDVAFSEVASHARRTRRMSRCE